MRKFVKAAAVLALAFALLSTSAFAALTGGSVDVITPGTYTATVEGAGEGEQVTILAVEAGAIEYNETTGKPELKNVTDSNILYIDQAASDTFANFQVKGDSVAGKEVFFFAGSATSDDAVLIGQKQNWLVSLSAGEATVEAGETIQIAASIQGGNYTGTATWTAEGATLSATSNNGATFTANAEGVYTVSYDLGIEGVAAATIQINVTAPSTALVKDGAPTIVKTKPGDVGAEAEAQHGVGVELKIAEAKAEFTKMIWVFVTSEAVDNRYYSEPVEISGVEVGSQMTIRAAFANGNDASALDVQSVDAIFTADNGATSYYTNEAADAPNKDKQ